MSDSTAIIAPSTISITPGYLKNTITWDYCPNEYFDDIDNWTITSKKVGTETAEVVSGKLHLDIPSSDSEVVLKYNYIIPDGDINIIIDFSGYSADSDEGFTFNFRFRDDLVTAQDYVNVYYRSRAASPTNVIGGSFKYNDSSTVNTTVYPAALPTKLRIRRIGTTLYTDYYSGGWVNTGSKDFGSRSSFMNSIYLYAIDLSNVGGSVDADNLEFIYSGNCFPNDNFNNLDSWWHFSASGLGTAILGTNDVTLDVPSGNNNSVLRYKYSLPDSNFDVLRLFLYLM